MRKPVKIILVITIVAIVASSISVIGFFPPSSTQYTNGHILVETNWLNNHFDDSEIRIIDVRSYSKYFESHIPNAVHLDIETFRTERNGIYYVISQDMLNAILSDFGITKETTIVLYDDFGGLYAAWVFWVLEYYDHEDVRILNGQFNKWIVEGRPTSQQTPQCPSSNYVSTDINSEIIATKKLILTNLNNSETILVDARSHAEYRGKETQTTRGGHIPGAINNEWTNSLVGIYTKVWKNEQQLTALFENKGILQDKQVIVYCQTGVRAAHSYFTLRLLGYPQIALYDGSWAEWSSDSTLPITPK
jgi:thiosulfate/3-mercaptopyruvate sulfurtransferase